MMKTLFAGTLIILFCSGAGSGRECFAIKVLQSDGTVFTDIDISGGAVTSGAHNFDRLRQLEIGADVTDAGGGITNVRFTFASALTAVGTYRKIPYCKAASPVLTCGPFAVDWNPAVDGKNFIVTFPIVYKHTKITATPTGHGAGDKLSLVMRGCY